VFLLSCWQVGGLRYSFNPTFPEDSRLVEAELLVDGTPTPLASFTSPLILLTTDYVAGGGDL